MAAAALFAAFPGWYATMFSGFYLVLLVYYVFRRHVGKQEFRPSPGN